MKPSRCGPFLRRPPMKLRISISAALAGSAFMLSLAAQAQSDSRFDGVWVGMESGKAASVVNAEQQKNLPKPHETRIVIAQGGKLVGIIDGICPGRFQQVHRSGDSLVFAAGDCHLNVTLSRDGRTLMEHGNCQWATMYTLQIPTGQTWPVAWVPLEITGTFHRAR
jgi:hypothetical protein